MSLLAYTRRLMAGALILLAALLLAGCGGNGNVAAPEPGMVPPISKADVGVNGYAVAGQVPAAGTQVPRGSRVRLKIQISLNLGPGGLGRSGSTVVPKLVGLSVNRAIYDGGKAGLRATVIPPDEALGDLLVRSQSLSPGSHIQAGTEIELTLA